MLEFWGTAAGLVGFSPMLGSFLESHAPSHAMETTIVASIGGELADQGR
jgi:hypothetical protein